MRPSETKVRAFDEFVRVFEPYDLFLTITFETVTFQEAARKSVKRFFATLNTRERVWYEKFIHCFIIYERNPDRQGVHLHGLLKGIKSNFARDLELELQGVFGWFCDVQAYDPDKGASIYFARKYAYGRLADYDYYKINSKYRGCQILQAK